MIGQKALLFGGLVTALALASAAGAHAKPKDPAGKAGWWDRLLAQEVPGLGGDEKPAEKPAAAAKPASATYSVTRQDGTKLQGKIHDKGDSIVVDTAEGPVEVVKADISSMRALPPEKPAEKPAETPPEKPAEKPPEKPSEAAPSSSARLVERPLYPDEEAEFGPVSPEHRGPIELSPYIASNFISHGMGIRETGYLAWGLRTTVNFGKDSEFGVDLDWHMSRPNVQFRRDVNTNTPGVKGVAVTETLATINWVEATFTYRIHALRIEYLTPYVSFGAGVTIIDGVDKQFIQFEGGVGTIRRVHEPITPAPCFVFAFGIDYKLDPNWAIRAEIRDEVFITSYNSRGGGIQILNSLTPSIGFVWAFD